MWVSRTIKAMGTWVTIRLEAEQAEKLLLDCLEQLETYEQVFSFHRPDSQLNLVNQAAGREPVVCPGPLFDLIALGKVASLEEGSALNIALGPLTRTWNFGQPLNLPEASSILDLLSYCQPQDIQLKPERQEVFLCQPGMRLDLGALAKGYTADLLLDFLKSQGARSVLLDFGGNVLVHGPAPQEREAWIVGLQKPFAPRGQHLGHILLKKGAVATSGVYERQTQLKGQVYHHLLDPKTGFPLVTPVTSLTVLAPTGLETEIWTSQLMGLAPEAILTRLNQTPGLEGLVTTQDKKLLLTEGLRNDFLPAYH